MFVPGPPQPLKGHKLTENNNGVPAWAETFIKNFDMVKLEVLDLMDAASLFRLEMYVQRVSLAAVSPTCMQLARMFWVARGIACGIALCRLVQLGAARIASDLLEVGTEVFEAFCKVKKFSEEDSLKLKDENPIGWKVHVEDVKDENYPDEEDAAAGAAAGSAAPA